MAGSDPSFNATDFRAQIRSVMAMAAPGVTSQGVSFYFPEQATWSNEDSAGQPWNWSATPVTNVPARTVTVPVAVEWSQGQFVDNPVGEFDSSRATLILLDQDYAQIQGATEVIINNQHYIIDREAPPIGLFDVTVHRLEIRAKG